VHAGEGVAQGSAIGRELPVRRTMTWPFCFLTTVSVRASSAFTANVVPGSPGWSVPSATTVSRGPPSKLKAYLFEPKASMRMSSTILLRETSSLHLPTNGSLAVQKMDAAAANPITCMTSTPPTNPGTA
jgi:hypothetical protein